MADLVQRLTANQPPQNKTPDFPLTPKLTVTGVEGGDGFSVVPSKSVIKVDVRLTPEFTAAMADIHIGRLVRGHDAVFNVPKARETRVKRIASEPPYALPDYAQLRLAMRDAIAAHRGPVPEKISNPSNIGCFLRAQGIDATAGFGLTAHNVHAANEYVELDRVEQVYSVYRDACKRLLGIQP
jgi:succinyl-diaminopimelate desuccinylase